MPRRSLLFVYGSLQQGEANHRLLGGAAFAGEAATVAGYELADLGDYPGLLAGGRHAVAGELYLVDAATLARLDHFEGHPDLFHRRRVALADGQRPWGYFIRPEAAGQSPRFEPSPDGAEGAAVRWVGPSRNEG